MSTIKATVKTAKLIAEERVETTLFYYTMMIFGVVVAGIASMAAVGLSIAGVMPVWLGVVVTMPFVVLYGIWKNKISQHGAKRILDELKIAPETVIRP